MLKAEASFRLDLLTEINELLGSAIMSLANIDLPIEGEEAKAYAEIQLPVIELLGRIFYLSEDELLRDEEDQPYLLIRQYSWYRNLLADKGEGSLVASFESVARVHGLFQSGAMITHCEIDELSELLFDLHEATRQFIQTFGADLDYYRETWQRELYPDQENGTVRPTGTSMVTNKFASGDQELDPPMTMEQFRAKYGDQLNDPAGPQMEIMVVMHWVSSGIYRFYILAPLEEWPLPLEEPSTAEDSGLIQDSVAAKLLDKLGLVGGIEGLSVTARYIELCVDDDPDWSLIRENLEDALFEVFSPRIRYIQFLSSSELTIRGENEAEIDGD